MTITKLEIAINHGFINLVSILILFMFMSETVRPLLDSKIIHRCIKWIIKIKN